MASRARRPPARARADGGPARRRHRADRLHGHLLDRPRAAAQPLRSRAQPPPSTSRSTHRSGRFRNVSGSSSWTGSCCVIVQKPYFVPVLALLVALPVRGDCSPAAGRSRRRGRSSIPAAGCTPRRWRSGRSLPLADRGDCRGSASSSSPRSSGSTCTTASAPRRGAGRNAPLVLRLDGRTGDPRPARGRRGGQRGTEASSARSARRSSPAASAGSASSGARQPVAA